MSSTQAPQSQPLASLEDSYSIVGELRARDGSRFYIGKRKDDGTDVLISIVGSPKGDQRNALSHLAADTKLLVGHRHRNLIRLLDGRWVGDDAFAVISARVASPTLRELLDRGEVISPPRIASILREVNGVLEWAREQRVIHRGVTPDTLYLDPKTDRILVSFTVRPMSITGMGDTIEDDARTIGRLAWSMLARASEDPEQSEESLATLRPDLPKRVVEQTEALLGSGSSAAFPKVLDYVSSVAMADALMVAEIETAHMEAVLLDEVNEERTLWSAERELIEQEFDRKSKQMTKEREELERNIAEERASLAARRQELERTTTEEREKLLRTVAKEREEMERKLTEERTALESRQRDLERKIAEERTSLESRRQELERKTSEERASIESHKQKLEREANEEREKWQRATAKEREELQRAFTKRQQEAERKFAKQTEEMERALAKQRAEMERTFAKQKEEIERTTAKQREDLQRASLKQNEAIASERTSLEKTIAKERAQIAADRAVAERALEKQRHELERALAKEREAMAAERATLERTLDEERQRLLAERAELERDRSDVDDYWKRTETRLRELEAKHAASLGVAAHGDLEELDEVQNDGDIGAIEPLAATNGPAMSSAVVSDREVPLYSPSLLAATVRDDERPRDDDLREDETRVDEEQLDDDGTVDTRFSAVAAPVNSTGLGERARQALGTRWAIPGAGLVLVLAVASALALSDDDAASTQRLGSASIVDSAAGTVVPASVVPMPDDEITFDSMPATQLGRRPPRATAWRSARSQPAITRPRPVDTTPLPEIATTRPDSAVVAPIRLPGDSAAAATSRDSFISRVWSAITGTDTARRDTSRVRPDSVRPDTSRPETSSPR
jgi:hypothetical protein